MKNTVFCVKRGVLWGGVICKYISKPANGKRKLYYLFKNEY